MSVTDTTDPRFKFYMNGNDWHGDDNLDSISETDESSNISFTEGVGTYRITLHDLDLSYTVVKQ